MDEASAEGHSDFLQSLSRIDESAPSRQTTSKEDMRGCGSGALWIICSSGEPRAPPYFWVRIR